MKVFRRRTFLFIPIGLLYFCVASARAQAWHPAGDNLKTGWTSQVQPDQPLNEYPRPELQRDGWQNLNGLWDYAITDATAAGPPASWQGKILVPFCVESSLSGVQTRVNGSQYLWYRREFRAKRPAGGGHLLLHFGACDWRTVVFLNGELVGSHAGGYDPFTFDLTPFLGEGDNQTLTVQVFDATDEGEPITRNDESDKRSVSDQSDQPRGKQTSIQDPNYFFYPITYTPTTGIWQTVWLEEVPGVYIERLVVKPDLDSGRLEVTAVTPGGAGPVQVTVRGPVNVAGGAEGAKATQGTGVANAPVELVIPDPQAWSPEQPALYDLEVTCGPDRVRSYFGFRTIERRKDGRGRERFYLNHHPIFLYGPLDQGYWPDGIYTAPTDEALAHDLDVEKSFGFNCVRKHIKVEPARWYYWADRKGLLVWQDFPALGPVLDADHTQNQPDFTRSPAAKAQIETEMRRMVEALACHPSIILWTVFNEAWGQYDTGRVTQLFQRWDPTRLVDSVSGWNDRGYGDLFDEHDYNPPARDPDTNGPFGRVGNPGRIVVIGEYGGRGVSDSGLETEGLMAHMWKHKPLWRYQELSGTAQLKQAVLDGISRVRDLARQGLGGAIYTQLTDVEGEANGLMTYDRDKFKVPPDAIREPIQAVIREGSTENDAPVSEVLVPGAEVSLRCLGTASGPGKYLDGSTRGGTIGLAAALNQDHTGTRWRVGQAEDGAVTLECLAGAAGDKWLDGRTAERAGEDPKGGAVALAVNAGGRSAGTKWQVWRVVPAAGSQPEVVALRCLGDVDGPRWLNGEPQSGTVDLAPNLDAPYTGTQWEVRPYQAATD